MAEAAASLQKERAEDEGKEATDEAAAAGEGHVSGGPVEKQSFFGKIKTGFLAIYHDYLGSTEFGCYCCSVDAKTTSTLNNNVVAESDTTQMQGFVYLS